MMQLEIAQQTIGSGSLKALFTGCGLPEKPGLLQALDIKFGLSYPHLPASYPFDRYLQMLDWLRQQLYPHDTEATGYEKLGRNITKGFFLGPAGQVLKLSIKVMGPQRSVPYFFKIAGAALRFGRFEVVEQKPGFVRAILWNVPGSPEVMRGMALESMEASAIKNPMVIYYKLDPNDTEFVARWEI